MLREKNMWDRRLACPDGAKLRGRPELCPDKTGGPPVPREHDHPRQNYRVAAANVTFGAGRRYQIRPPVSTRPIAMSCVPVKAPPKTEPRPGSPRKNSIKK